nr:MAG TPA: cysteine-rich protein [Caudoviricetes sp.]
MQKETEYKKIRCPVCNRVITESTLDYDFTAVSPTCRYLCSRCKNYIYYTVKERRQPNKLSTSR